MPFRLSQYGLRTKHDIMVESEEVTIQQAENMVRDRFKKLWNRNEHIDDLEQELFSVPYFSLCPSLSIGCFCIELDYQIVYTILAPFFKFNQGKINDDVSILITCAASIADLIYVLGTDNNIILIGTTGDIHNHHPDNVYTPIIAKSFEFKGLEWDWNHGGNHLKEEEHDLEDLKVSDFQIAMQWRMKWIQGKMIAILFLFAFRFVLQGICYFIIIFSLWKTRRLEL